jgi:hypothetical protein
MTERVMKVFTSEELRQTLGFWLKANSPEIVSEVVKGNVVQIEGTFFITGNGLAKVTVRGKSDERLPSMAEIKKKVDKLYLEIMGVEPKDTNKAPTMEELERKIEDISDSVKWEKECKPR